MTVIAIIPARGGSQEIKNKNLRKIKGKPLIQFTIEAAKKSNLIDKIYVSSDSDKILNFAKKMKVNYIKRPKKISTSKSKTIEAIKHLAKFLRLKKNIIPDYIVILQPTSPLRKPKHINNAIQQIKNSKKADSLVSCIKVKHNFNPESLMTIDKKGILRFKKKLIRRQDKKVYFARNGAAIYIIKYPTYLKDMFGKITIPYVMNQRSSYDIDDNEDLLLIKKLI